MKLLTITEIVSAAEDSDVDGLDRHIELIEAAVTQLADALAEKLDIECTAARFEPDEFGITVSFYPSKPAQECPECIDAGDRGGDWEYPKQQKTK